MVKEIIKDEFFLKQKSKSCTKEDLYIANELLETIQAYKEQCVGMAANMIGYLKTMMVVLDENNQICYKSYESHKAQVRQKALDKLVELKKVLNEIM